MPIVNSAIYGDSDYWDGTICWGFDPSDDSQITSEAASQAIYGNPRKGFSSVASWEADRMTNALSTDDEFGYIQSPWVDDDGEFIIRDWTQTPLSTTLITIGEARHTGIVDTSTNGPHRAVGTNQNQANISNLTIDGLQCLDQNNNVAGCLTIPSDSTNVTIKNCVLRPGPAGNGIMLNDSAITALIQNTLIYYDGTQGGGTEGIYCDSVGTVYISNCIVWNFNDGIERDAGTVTVKNTTVGNCNDDFDGAMTIDFCCSDEQGGTNAFGPSGASWANEFVDQPNGDFSILNTGNCYLGSDVTFDDDNNIPTVDILGTARNTGVGETTSVGAFEFDGGTTANEIVGNSTCSEATESGEVNQNNNQIEGISICNEALTIGSLNNKIANSITGNSACNEATESGQVGQKNNQILGTSLCNEALTIATLKNSGLNTLIGNSTCSEATESGQVDQQNNQIVGASVCNIATTTAQIDQKNNQVEGSSLCNEAATIGSLSQIATNEIVGASSCSEAFTNAILNQKNNQIEGNSTCNEATTEGTISNPALNTLIGNSTCSEATESGTLYTIRKSRVVYRSSFQKKYNVHRYIYTLDEINQSIISEVPDARETYGTLHPITADEVIALPHDIRERALYSFISGEEYNTQGSPEPDRIVFKGDELDIFVSDAWQNNTNLNHFNYALLKKQVSDNVDVG